MNYLNKINQVIEYIIKTTKFSSEEEKSQIIEQLTDMFMGECLLEYSKLIKKQNKSLSKKEITSEEDFRGLLKEIRDTVGEKDYVMVLVKKSEALVRDLAGFIGGNASLEYIREYNDFVKRTFQS